MNANVLWPDGNENRAPVASSSSLLHKIKKKIPLARRIQFNPYPPHLHLHSFG